MQTCEEFLWKINPECKCSPGLDNYLFLVNDSGQELRQHFSPEFVSHFKLEEFTAVLDNHQKIAKERNCTYLFVLTPDKSIILKDKLPFDTTNCSRLIDRVQHLAVCDLFKTVDLEKQGHTSDSHINWLNAYQMLPSLLAALGMPHIYDSVKYLVSQPTWFHVQTRRWVGDLVSPANYHLELPSTQFVTDTQIFSYLPCRSNQEAIPDEFKTVHSRLSGWFANDRSLTPKRLLLFRDSTAEYFLPFLNSVFREVFAYWDHWDFNIDLIGWFKPDIIIEMRTERFLNTNFANIK